MSINASDGIIGMFAAAAKRVVMCLVLATTTSAVDTTFIATNGLWQTAANWDFGKPGPTTNVFIDGGSSVSSTVIVNSASVASWENAFTYYILLYAIGTFVTGKLIKFKPLIIGGSINFVLAIVCSRLPFDYQLLLGAAAILISYIIPGHLLRKQYQHH